MSGEVKETAHSTETTNSTGAGRADDAPRRRLFVMRAGARLFAVYADEVEATCENLLPTPLPFAPPPVRGVVSRRGRIFTLIDPLPLLPAAPHAEAQTSTTRVRAPFVVALKGDEQLALAADKIEHDIELYGETNAPREGTHTHAAHDATPTDPDGNSLPLRRIIPYRAEWIALLDPARLFDASMRGVERRRQRT